MTNLAYKDLMNNEEVLAELDRRYTARQKRIETKKRAKALYYLKQKFWGLILTALGVVIPIINNGDATASLVLLPLGIYLMITKEKVMTF